MKAVMRMTQVHETLDISPHMRRIILTGDDLSDFPCNQESAHVKVIIPEVGYLKPRLELNTETRKRMRSYTVRSFNPLTKTLAIDFVVNDHQGLVTAWASQAQKGDYLGIAGPGPIKHTNPKADWHILIGDMTALPAIAATAERLPEEASGHIIIQVPRTADKQAIKHPDNLSLEWVINENIHKNKLLTACQGICWQPGSPACLIAGEAMQVREIHQYIKLKPDYNKEYIYASGYWKHKK